MSIAGTREMTRVELERYKLYTEIAELERKILASSREYYMVQIMGDGKVKGFAILSEMQLLQTEMKTKTDQYLLIK